MYNLRTIYPLLLSNLEQLQKFQKWKSFVIWLLIISKWVYMRKPRFTRKHKDHAVSWDLYMVMVSTLKLSLVSCPDKRSSLTMLVWDFCSCHTGNRPQKSMLLFNIFYQKVSSVEIYIHTMSETRNSRMVYATPPPLPSCFGYNENQTELKVKWCFIWKWIYQHSRACSFKLDNFHQCLYT